MYRSGGADRDRPQRPLPCQKQVDLPSSGRPHHTGSPSSCTHPHTDKPSSGLASARIQALVTKPQTVDIRDQLILLGTGTSVGVPAIGCDCSVCNSPNPRNNRMRASAVVGLPEGNLLIDTSPDLRSQLLREGIGLIHATLYTHEHADHLFGLDDLRLFSFYLNGPVPLFCQPDVEARIRKSYDYAFSDAAPTHKGATPRLEFRTIDETPFHVLGAPVIPIRLQHGPRFEVLGFRFGNVAYCTDTNFIPAESMAKLEGLDVLILDALRPEPHATHFSLEQAVEVARQLKPKMTYFTHISHHLEYESTNASLSHGMELAYDGLRIDLGSNS